MTAPTKNSADRDLVLAHIRSVVPGLERDAAAAALRQAKADHWSSFARLAAHFRTHPNALTQLDDQAPAPLIRLAHTLHAAARGDVAAPRCADCGRLTDKARQSGTGGRICGTCNARRQHAPCARCGQRRRIYARRSDGGICGPCYNADTSGTSWTGPSPSGRNRADSAAGWRRRCGACRTAALAAAAAHPNRTTTASSVGAPPRSPTTARTARSATPATDPRRAAADTAA
jgi:hypothetical protein